MTPSELSRELRLHRSPDLRRRRWLIGLSFAGVALGQIVGLYQTGIESMQDRGRLARLGQDAGSLGEDG